MAWFKVDDNFYDHPKVDELSLEAVGLWTLCGTYAARHLTDGFVPDRRVTRLGGNDNTAGELVDAELWDPAEGGYTFRNWGEYQPTRGGVESKREADRERKRKQRRNEAGQFSVSQKSHTVTPSGIPAESHRPSHGASQNGHADTSKTPFLHSTAKTAGTGPHPGETSNLAQLGIELPQNHADLVEMSAECHTVTPDGLTAESHPESHRPDPTRPDPTRNTLLSHASGADEEKESQPEPVFSEDVHGLAEYLAGWIVHNGNRKPNVTKTWLQSIDRLIRLDGYTPEQIRQVIDWSQSDEFWQDNIMSAAKLRKQFDQLKNRMLKDRQRNTGPAGMAPGSQRALSTLQLGQALQAEYENTERKQIL